jgi:hypothetical protein
MRISSSTPRAGNVGTLDEDDGDDVEAIARAGIADIGRTRIG